MTRTTERLLWLLLAVVLLRLGRCAGEVTGWRECEQWWGTEQSPVVRPQT
jgi:hypothetical protein